MIFGQIFKIVNSISPVDTSDIYKACYITLIPLRFGEYEKKENIKISLY